MKKLKNRIIVLAAAVIFVLTIGACQKPAEVSQAPVLPPPRPKKVAAGAESGGQAVVPGNPTKVASAAGAKNNSAKSKPGAKTKPAKTGTSGQPTMARGGGDPFQPGAARTGGAAPTTTGTTLVVPKPARMIVYAGRRKDPFYIDWKLPVPPPYVFDEVEPIRLASDAIETPHVNPFEVREQPEMRVSGIMTGDGVFAILESGGDKVDVVKPGSSVDISVGGQTKRTYKVVSITKDKVKLRSQVGNIIYTQEVPLSDVAVGTPQRTAFTGATGAAPGGSFGGGSFGGGSFGGSGSFGPPGRRPGGSGGGSAGPGGSAGRRGR